MTEKEVSPFIQEVLFTNHAESMNEVLNEDYDIHLNYNSLIMGYKISKRFKTVFDLADDIPAMIRHSPQIPSFLRPFGSLMGKYYLKKNVNVSDFVTITTPQLIENIKIPEDKIRVIPNGVDSKTFRFHKNAKEKLGLNGIFLGYVGVLREWVDFKPIFEAMTSISTEIKFLIVGSEGNLIKTKELVKNYNLNDRVIFTGMIPYSQVPLYISAMDICLIPFGNNAIAKNALPLKLFEYMACERPVISSDIDTIKSIMGSNVLYASNSADYKKNIELLIQNPEFMLKLGLNGRNIIEKHYNWKVIVGKLEKLMKELKG
ncbi:glycosyltransferase [Methanobacterium sp. MZD130B]|uniref:glycosyltransferase n=1 Tax=Methanobacterium sp. MZD130B TaxID=3394378 RepID=UPI0039FCD781